MLSQRGFGLFFSCDVIFWRSFWLKVSRGGVSRRVWRGGSGGSCYIFVIYGLGTHYIALLLPTGTFRPSFFHAGEGESRCRSKSLMKFHVGSVLHVYFLLFLLHHSHPHHFSTRRLFLCFPLAKSRFGEATPEPNGP